MSRKKELLDQEDAGWHELCARVEKVRDLARPGVNGDWSVKDLLAHIAAWHAKTIDRLETLRSTGTLPGAPDIDAFNDEIYDECKDLSIGDVRAMFSASRHRFREEVALLDDDLDGRLATLVTGNAHGHYLEHLPDLDRALETE